MPQEKNSDMDTANKLCSSCRRTCKQAANAVVASCPRYYPFKKTGSKPVKIWQQQDLELF